MKSRNRILCEHSLGMALSAIEIYNKPNFSNREQIFCILIVSAWEALLKSKILKDNKNKISSLYVKDVNGKFKKNRNKENLTFSIDEAMSTLSLPEPVDENIKYLIRIRDAAIHLTAESKSLPYIVFSLGSAALKNYARLLSQWHSLNLGEYNFYILPLGFSYPFKTMSLAELQKEPETISAIISDLESQKGALQPDTNYSFVCEIQTTLVSAKKMTIATDLTGKIDQSSSKAIIVNRKVNLLDQYPFSWTQIYDKLKEEFPSFKNHHLNDLIRKHKIKGDNKYCEYNYRNKQEEAKGPKSTTPSIYNNDFLEFARSEFQKLFLQDSSQ